MIMFVLFDVLPDVPSRVLHLWGVDPLMEENPPSEQFAQAQYSGFYSLLFLMNAANGRLQNTSLWIITSNTQAVTGAETLHPEKATVLGACRVLPQENIGLNCHYIDVVWPQDDERQLNWLTNQLLAEFMQQTQASITAYRGDTRWEQIYEPVYLEAINSPVLRQKGVYLITGGWVPLAQF